ncbi:peptidoglycan-binding protein LysM [Arenibacter lacus]|uniref:peptidoglycan-binding protein LysM n=1 Tax=Arenibacter lacus TaxID=2608629 RepID=UPI00123C9D52|nr:peptidoglycan-binding protein LysM [Arenibacter lacus]
MQTTLKYCRKKRATNIVAALTMLLFGVSKVAAQKATTTINLILADVIAIEPGSAAKGGTVDFHYENASDYNSEQTATIPNSLIITFTHPFDLKVKANGAYFENGAHQIPVNVLTISRNETSKITGNSKPIVLSTEDQVLVSGADSGSKLNLDLDYKIPQARSSSPDMLGKPEGKYTQKVTYTVSAL